MQRSKYGLGDRRTLQQSIEFSGIDTIHGKILDNRCGNVYFVPFTQHPEGPDYIPAFDEATEGPLDPPDVGSIYYKAKLDLERSMPNQKTNIPNAGPIFSAVTSPELEVLSSGRHSAIILAIIALVFFVIARFYSHKSKIVKYFGRVTEISRIDPSLSKSV